ncbi:hypothetical protein DPMN_123928 [Dreissena polymorpha]|uniref:Uncharacterized protein n=1 Tax=Dreissena polymorpha TaxID=45954 RepID=A0A9D4JVS9_DREPO|nr:hypothetical protein DPMN_123928 [Dreissena polymorpha]
MTPSQSHCCGINSYESVSNSVSEQYVLGSAAGLEPFSDQGTVSFGSLLVHDHLMHHLTAPSMSALALDQRI